MRAAVLNEASERASDCDDDLMKTVVDVARELGRESGILTL